MKLRLKFFLISFSIIIYAYGQDTDRKIQFPDLPEYLTLKADLHIHTVFSDGSVWPNIRVEEAVMDGLDAISLTEHLEYQPHKDDIPHPDRNRSFIIASEIAKPHDLLIIHGAEITRSMPPGHANALFIQDANQLIIEDPIQAYEEANRQGAFVFWNHPDWIRQREDGVAKMTDMHQILIDRKLLHGIEVVNDMTYSEEALKISIDEQIVPLGTSDIHGLVDYQYRIAQGGHRPITLIFAKERTVEGIKEALFDGRCIAWFDNLLVGREEWLKKLINSSLTFEFDDYIGPTSVLKVKVTNSSDAAYLLKNNSVFSFQMNSDVIEVQPHSTKTLHVRVLEQKREIELDFEILNAIISRNVHPNMKFKVSQN